MDLAERLRDAVRLFWEVRERQGRRQGRRGVRDRGSRAKVTGGRPLDGVLDLLRHLLVESGVPSAAIHLSAEGTLPGWCRPTKQWDLIVVHENRLIASVECKSQVGSIGNNANNRAEEFLGVAFDHRKAHEDAAFGGSPPPWIGLFMLLEDSEATRRASSPPREPHFPILPEFRRSSYADRYRIAFEKMLRIGLFNAVAFLMSGPEDASEGRYSEPSADLAFARLSGLLLGHCAGYFRFGGGAP